MSPAKKTEGGPRVERGCSLCGDLKERESAFQKFGWEEGDTWLPKAAEALTTLLDLRPGSSRMRQLRQCPECGTYYLYETDYEYLVNGSEDEQVLTRLGPEEAERMLNEAGPGEAGRPTTG